MSNKNQTPIASRFRGFLPIVIDLETAGFDSINNAILEVSAVMIDINDDGLLQPTDVYFDHILPFEGSTLDPDALKFLNIKDPGMLSHPFRYAVEEKQALEKLFKRVSKAVKHAKCQRAVLVGHNPAFDLEFLKAAVARHKIKFPFHAFTTFDTACLSAVAYGETVLAKATRKAGIQFETKEAHSAKYDAVKTAELFCLIANGFTQI